MNISVRLLKDCLFVSLLVALQLSVLPSTVIDEAYDRLQAAHPVCSSKDNHLRVRCSGLNWSPHLHKDITILEKIQQFASKMCTKTWDCSYNEPLDRLQLPTLAQHKLHLSLCFMYRIIHGLNVFCT